jgi:hypothetical protein
MLAQLIGSRAPDHIWASDEGPIVVSTILWPTSTLGGIQKHNASVRTITSAFEICRSGSSHLPRHDSVNSGSRSRRSSQEALTKRLAIPEYMEREHESGRLQSRQEKVGQRLDSIRESSARLSSCFSLFYTRQPGMHQGY